MSVTDIELDIANIIKAIAYYDILVTIFFKDLR